MRASLSGAGPEKVRVSSLRYAVAGTEILKGVNTTVPAGRITSVVGPSGAGKSTLLRAINRLIEPTAGEVYLDGIPTSQMDPLVLRRRVGMVFQLPVLFEPSVKDAILYGPRLSGESVDAGDLLEAVGLGVSFEDRDPRSLSIGQQQRVSIASALALWPEVLLMDEPTSALDEAARRRLEELIRDLNGRMGLTILLVSHDLAQVERVADRVVLIVSGRDAGEWSADEFFSEGGNEQMRLLSSGRL